MAELIRDPSFRPSRLLNLNKASKANKAISALNSVNSPLLTKLSAEIRARIFGYALGGNTIHIDRDGYPIVSFRARLCEYPEDYDDISDRCRFYDSIDKADHPEDHSRCRKGKSLTQKVAFGLLSSCRQINSEGALLPFGKNRFVTEAPWNGMLIPAFFQAYFNPTQVKAIQHLIVRCATGNPRSLYPGKVLAQLSGLKTFEVLLDLALTSKFVDSLGTPDSSSAHNGSGNLRLPSVHIGVDYHNEWNFRIGSLNGGLLASAAQTNQTKNGVRLWQRDRERTLLERPEQERLEKVAKEKARKLAKLAEEQAHKEKQVVVRSARGLRSLGKKA